MTSMLNEEDILNILRIHRAALLVVAPTSHNNQ